MFCSQAFSFYNTRVYTYRKKNDKQNTRKREDTLFRISITMTKGIIQLGRAFFFFFSLNELYYSSETKYFLFEGSRESCLSVTRQNVNYLYVFVYKMN